MSDHFKFNISVAITDRWHMAYEERGEELKKDCVSAVKKVLEEHGFREYREEFWVTA
jgi:hypothetical protein